MSFLLQLFASFISRLDRTPGHPVDLRAVLTFAANRCFRAGYHIHVSRIQDPPGSEEFGVFYNKSFVQNCWTLCLFARRQIFIPARERTVPKLNVIVLLPVLGLAACTGPSLYEPMPQSAFAFPNSDVVPLTHVRATVSRFYIMPFQSPNFDNAAMRREAYLQALKGTNADIIIDGDYSVRTKLFPILLVFVQVQGTVEGTAARVTRVGSRSKSQNLR
jgi:hypothetical protein